MAGGLIGALRVTLGIDAAQFESGITGATRRARQMQRELRTIGDGITRAGRAMSVGLTLPVAAFLRTAIPAAREAREAIGQVSAALESMGPASQRNAEQLQASARALMRISTFDDDDILRGVTSNLLTFGRVSGDVFDRAQRSIVDMASRMRMQLQPATIMIGKALNDPIRGMQQLRRVGIQFTEAQQTAIRAAMAHNNIIGAQTIMLEELERQFGGSAQAMHDAQPDQAFINQWNDFSEVVGEIALQLLPPLTAMLTSVLDRFQALSPEMQRFAVYAVGITAALGPLLMILGPVVSFSGRLITLLATMGTAGSAAGGVMAGLGVSLAGLATVLVPVAAAVGAAYLAWRNWDKIAPVLSRLWQVISTTLGPPLVQMVGTISGALSDLWNGPFGTLLGQAMTALSALTSLFARVFGPPVLQLLRGLAVGVGVAFQAVADWVNVLASLLTGDFSGAWNSIKSLVSNVVQGIGRVIEAMVPGALNSLQNLYLGAKNWLVDKFNQLYEMFMTPIRRIADGFRWLYDVVVGHSYVPDMMTQVGQEFARLDKLMVDPSARATRRTADNFREMATEVRAILDRLYPDEAASRALRDDLALLERARGAGVFPTERAYQDAVNRRADEGMARPVTEDMVPSFMTNGYLERITEAARGTLQGMEDWLVNFSDRSMPAIANAMIDPIVRVTNAFNDMAQGAIDSARDIIDAFKSGDFLSALQGVLGLVTQVINGINGSRNGGGVMGFLNAFSQGAAALGGRPPGFSTGGTFKVGGSGGVDSQLVRFRASPGEMVHVTRGDRANQPVAIRVHVAASDYFDARVEQVAAPLADNAAARGSFGGLALAAKHQARQNKGRLA